MSFDISLFKSKICLKILLQPTQENLIEGCETCVIDDCIHWCRSTTRLTVILAQITMQKLDCLCVAIFSPRVYTVMQHMSQVGLVSPRTVVHKVNTLVSEGPPQLGSQRCLEPREPCTAAAPLSAPDHPRWVWSHEGACQPLTPELPAVIISMLCPHVISVLDFREDIHRWLLGLKSTVRQLMSHGW